ncbi:MAG: hypothetical protein GXY05_08615 [Clostridiales bacterium]|nr:hypothetical protein [Clostridiales bacterium]
MPDYEKLYRIVFNGITDALDAIEREEYQRAREILVKAQQAAEDYYVEDGEEENDPPSGGSEDLPLYVLPHDVFESGAGQDWQEQSSCPT